MEANPVLPRNPHTHILALPAVPKCDTWVWLVSTSKSRFCPCSAAVHTGVAQSSPAHTQAGNGQLQAPTTIRAWSAPCPAADPAPDNTKVHSLGPWGQCPAQQAAHALRRGQDLPEGHPLPSAQTLGTGLLIPFCPGLSPAPAGDTVLWYSCPLSLPNQALEGPRLHRPQPPVTTRQGLGERSASPLTQKPRGAPSDFKPCQYSAKVSKRII